jgi:hypothetical protein
MIIHHIITALLCLITYFYGIETITLAIFIIHSFSDIFYYITCFQSIKQIKIYKKLRQLWGIIFIFSRLFLHGYLQLFVINYSPERFRYIINMTWILYAIQVYWCVYILWVGFIKGHTEDNRPILENKNIFNDKSKNN